MSKILITGSKGQLGIELNRILSPKHDLFLTDTNELDITNLDQVYEVAKEIRPEVIINAAAFTAVDLCEEQEELAYKVNALGPKNLSEVSNHIGARLVHISTDYVFDGKGIKDNNEGLRPYVENDPTSPQNVYGRTKLEGENFVKNVIDQYYIIRTAWLYGEGKNFVNTMLDLSKKYDTIRVVKDQLGTPTSTLELANMIEEIIYTDAYGVYHGTCEGQCSWYDFTKEIFDLSGIHTKVIPVTSDEFPRPAKRPEYSVLENKKLNENNLYKFKSWKVALKNYL